MAKLWSGDHATPQQQGKTAEPVPNVQKACSGGTISDVAVGQHEGDGSACRVGQHVYLGGPSAARSRLKLAMPEYVYHLMVGPASSSFRTEYPEIEVEIDLTDALSDILEEGLHAGFRLGDRISEDMVAVRLTSPLKLLIAASPAYLEANGTPKSPKDLLEHSCIRYRFPSSKRISVWHFKGGNGEYSVDVPGGVIVNTLPVSVDLAKQGVGLVYTFRDYCADDIKDKSLVSVLDKRLPNTPGVFIYFPREYRSMMPLRLFLDHLKQTFAEA